MNANELAEELHDLDVQASQQSLNDWAEQAATMLRKLQAENDALKVKYEAEYAKAFENGYAIGLSHGKDLAKTLTDEEILSCWFESGQMLTIQQARIQFARAILRKAQEE